MATNTLEVEVEPQPASVERLSGATKIMRRYDGDGDGKFSKDEVHAMAVDFIKEKKTRRLATKAAIAMGVLILLRRSERRAHCCHRVSRQGCQGGH